MTSKTLWTTLLLVLTCLSPLIVKAEAQIQASAPRSDGRLLHVDFENYVDGVVQALNAGVRWLGDPFSGRKQGRVEITRSGAFGGSRAAFVATSAADEIGRVRLQRRFDAPHIAGDMVMEFVFRPSPENAGKLETLTLWSAHSSSGNPVGLTLNANRETSEDSLKITVTHTASLGSRDTKTASIEMKDSSTSKWIRLIQYRRRKQQTVELWGGAPGSENLLGTFADLDPLSDLVGVEFGDTSTSANVGSGYWDDIRVGGLLGESSDLARPEPALRDVSQETVRIPSPIPAGRAKHLFLDDVIIESRQGIERHVYQARKHPQNPLLVPEKPWEGRCILLYGGVVRDPESKLFRMWYLAWGKHVGQPSYICYAESEDGLNWRKPLLKLHPHENSTDNNIVLPGWSQTSVLFDPTDPNPARRYKALLRYKGTRGFTSPDGLHWTDVGVLLEQAYDSTTMHWDPVNRKWVAMVKIFKDGKRARGYAESRDFLHWSDTYFMSSIDQRDAEDDEMYAMSMFHYGTNYLGLLRMYHKTRDIIDIQLATSRNGKSWTRLAREKPFIPTGAKQGDWDFGNNAVPATPPIQVGDELWFYYCGRSTLHNEIPNDGAIGLATLRLDGFASMDAANEGSLTTKPLSLEGQKLLLNADAANGEIRVEILDADGQTLSGYERESASVIVGDEIRHQATWANDQKLPHQPVRLKFHLSRAKLFAFWVE